MTRSSAIYGFLIALALLAGAAAPAAQQADAASAVAAGQFTNWTTHNGGPAEANYSGLNQLNRRNIRRLGLAWSLNLVGEVSLEATPLAIDGTLYFTGSSSDVYAVDAVSGRLLWKFDPEIWKYRPEHLKLVWGINRGVAYSNGRVFVGTLDGRLIALDGKSGVPIWTVKTVADDSVQTITGAPLVVKGTVLIGNGGADFGARGYVTAYDASTGRMAWRFYTVPGDPAKGFENEAMAMAAKTWSGQWWNVGGGGGTVWDNMTYDPELNQIYIGVGNAGPWNPRLRSPGGGDNLFVASIVALNADTGKYVWHYQVNPGESWDYKATANMITTDLNINGKTRKVVMQSPSNGFFYVIDRVTGKLISAEKIGKTTWADHIDLATGRPVEVQNAHYDQGSLELWPSSLGSHSWQGMSFNPSTGLVYIPSMQLGERITDDKSGRPDSNDPPVHFGGVYVDLLVRDTDDDTGALLAWDPISQKQRWKVRRAAMWNGGVLSTAGELVFQGTADGEFEAFDAVDGHRLWSFNAHHGIIACPVTYAVAGRQYVSILAGYGGTIGPFGKLMNRGWKFGAQPRRLLTFALGESAKLPPTAPADFAVHAVDDRSLVIDPDQARVGLIAYQGNCAYCHGRLLQSPGAPAPDLRESAIALNWTSFHATLKEGTLLPKLMPNFGQMSEQQMRDIYIYIRAGARQALEQPSAATRQP
jgi:quinohemoprotein ethanol dehydrogenase